MKPTRESRPHGASRTVEHRRPLPLNGNSARRNKGQTSRADVAVFGDRQVSAETGERRVVQIVRTSHPGWRPPGPVRQAFPPHRIPVQLVWRRHRVDLVRKPVILADHRGDAPTTATGRWASSPNPACRRIRRGGECTTSSTMSSERRRKCSGFDHEPVAGQLLHLGQYLRSTRGGRTSGCSCTATASR